MLTFLAPVDKIGKLALDFTTSSRFKELGFLCVVNTTFLSWFLQGPIF